jgi:hypothetical protein
MDTRATALVCCVLAACNGGGRAGEGRDGGISGHVDAGGDGAVGDGAIPHVDAGPDVSAPVPWDDIFRSCVLEMSCPFVDGWRSAVDVCVEFRAIAFLQRAWSVAPWVDPCLLEATDCTTLAACAAAIDTASCDSDPFPRCSGDVVMACDRLGRRIATNDCAADGLACVDGQCTDGVTCEVEYSIGCDGDIAWDCNLVGDARSARRCEEGCQVAPDGTFTLCTEHGVFCTRTDNYCEGDLFFRCYSSSAAAPVDCRDLGAVCDVATSYCQAPCPLEQRRTHCNGTTVAMCAGGDVVEIDCTTLGFSGCGTVSATSGPSFSSCS